MTCLSIPTNASVEHATAIAIAFQQSYAGAARRRGYTREIWAVGADDDMHLLVKPDADLTEVFWASDLDECDFVRVNPRLFRIEEYL